MSFTTALSEDDPVYYKVKINELIKQAKENGLTVCLQKEGFLNFMCIENSEIASVDLRKLS